jgi:RNA polymerase sigma-70 factor (ECF subfamily)
MAYLEDKKSAEIAEHFNLSIRTVEHHLYLGLKTLRSGLIEKKE